MAYLPKVQECKNGCGASIYFDKDSKVSHPSQDKWLPLEYNDDTGVYTGEKHNCPKYSNGNGYSSQQQQQQTQQKQQQVKIPPFDQSKQSPQQQQPTDLALEVKLLHQKIVQLNEKVDKILGMLERQHGAVSA